MKTYRSDEEYDKLFDEFYEAYPADLELPYSSVLDKLNLRLDFMVENHAIKPMNLELHQIVNYRDTIKQLFQPNFDLVIRAFIHKKVASKFIALYRRIQHNKTLHKNAAMNVLSKAFNQ